MLKSKEIEVKLSQPVDAQTDRDNHIKVAQNKSNAEFKSSANELMSSADSFSKAFENFFEAIGHVIALGTREVIAGLGKLLKMIAKGLQKAGEKCDWGHK